MLTNRVWFVNTKTITYNYYCQLGLSIHQTLEKWRKEAKSGGADTLKIYNMVKTKIPLELQPHGPTFSAAYMVNFYAMQHI